MFGTSMTSSPSDISDISTSPWIGNFVALIEPAGDGGACRGTMRIPEDGVIANMEELIWEDLTTVSAPTEATDALGVKSSESRRRLDVVEGGARRLTPLPGPSGKTFSFITESITGGLVSLRVFIALIVVLTTGVLAAGIDWSIRPSDRTISGSLLTDVCFREPKIDNFLTVAKLFFLDGVLGGAICDGRFVEAAIACIAAGASTDYRSIHFTDKDTFLSDDNFLGFAPK